MTTLCLVLTALAAACTVPGPRTPGPLRWRRPGLSLLAGGLAIPAWWAADRPHVLALSAVAVAIGLVSAWLVARRRADAGRRRTRSRVVAACEGLRAELEVGQAPTAALSRAAADWSLLAPVDRTSGAGGDVPSALRRAAAAPGAADLRLLAAAWEVTHRTGHGLADAVGRVAADLRAADRTRRIVTGELASARATARLVAGLPVLALVMGSGTGADPWGFLFGHPFGIACLAAGAACQLAGLAWIEAIARDVDRAV